MIITDGISSFFTPSNQSSSFCVNVTDVIVVTSPLGTWVKKATLNIGTKLTIRKPFFKIVYGQNPTQEGTEMTFSFYDLGSFAPYL